MEHPAKPPGRLPLEIVQEIVKFLPGADLKNMRRSSQEFKRLSEPLLFRRIVLVPSAQCLEEFHEVFDFFNNKSHTRLGIRELVYDDRWLPTVDVLRKKVKDHGNEQESDADANAQTLKALDAFKASYFVSPEEGAIEVALLARIFETLCSVNSVYIIDEQLDGILLAEQIPYYLVKLCQQPKVFKDLLPVTAAGWTGRGPQYSSRIFRVLSAMYAVGRGSRYLKVANLHWHSCLRNSLPTKYNTIVRYGLEDLDRIDLEWHCKKRQAVYITMEYLSRVHEVLRMAENVRSLRVCLHSRPLGELENEISYEDSYTAALLEGQDGYYFRRLRHASLEALVTYENELIRFIKAHRKLREVELKNILLLREASDTPRGCFVKIIQSLASHGRLERVDFGGYLSNGGNQLWYPHPVPTTMPLEQQTHSLKHRIEAYVTNKTTVLPQELTRNAVTTPHRDVLPPSPSLPWVKGDCTWSMTQRTSPPPDVMFFEDQESEEEIWIPPPPSPGDQSISISVPSQWGSQTPSPPPLPLSAPTSSSQLLNPPPPDPHLILLASPSNTDDDRSSSDVDSWGGEMDVDADAVSKGSPGTSTSASDESKIESIKDVTEHDVLANFDFDAFLNEQTDIKFG